MYKNFIINIYKECIKIFVFKLKNFSKENNS